VQDLKADRPNAVSAAARELVVVKSGSTWACFDGVCPHQGALLGEGELEGGTLICRNHRWAFSAETGKRTGGPQCLQRFDTKEEDGRLWVRVPAAMESDAAGAKLPRMADLPGPRQLPFFGNALKLGNDQIHRQLEEWAEEYGHLFQIRIGPLEFTVSDDPALIGEVFRRRPQTFRRAKRLEPVFRELGLHGVFSAEGEEWRGQRRLAMGALSHRHLTAFYPTLKKVAERLIRRLSKLADSGEAVDIQSEMMRFTVDVTTTLAFGRDFNTIDGGDQQVQQHLSRVFPKVAKRLTAPIPTWRFIRSLSDRKLDRSLAELRAMLAELIDDARKTTSEGEEARNFLEAMLKARDKDGEPYGEDALFGNAMTMLLAGEDTTANTIAWAVHLLCDHPEAVSKLREEASRTMGDHLVAASLEQTSNFDYVMAVANETMRIHPVAPLFFFHSNESCDLPGVHIDAGDGVCLLTRRPGMAPEFVDDPERFAPERWLDPRAVSTLQKNTVHIPFGSGPRICPGRSLALLEMKMVLSALYKNFEIERIGTAEDVRESFNFTVQPVGLAVKLHRRQAEATQPKAAVS
jgi:cytochrome P450/nitrite reductase/ring-hydroxylating ferredoxin subunit